MGFGIMTSTMFWTESNFTQRWDSIGVNNLYPSDPGEGTRRYSR